MPRILVVDDDRAQRRILGTYLGLEGFTVDLAASAEEALPLLDDYDQYDAIILDQRMPGLSGIELLTEIRARAPDLPVLMVTAMPDLESAIGALDLAATKYMVKPVERATLVAAINKAIGLYKLARLRQLVAITAAELEIAAKVTTRRTEVRRAMSAAWVVYQPIVSVRLRQVLAYEALVRTVGMTPDELITQAHAHGEIIGLGRMIRRQIATMMGEYLEAKLFVNLHPAELHDEDLYNSLSPLGRYARRVTLEITERASLDVVDDLGDRLRRLRVMGYRLAVDDLGAGYAGLASIVLLEPDVIKLDASMVRDIHLKPEVGYLVTAMAEAAHKGGRVIVAEAVETIEESRALLLCGVSVHQGYFYARPGAALPEVNWGPEITSGRP